MVFNLKKKYLRLDSLHFHYQKKKILVQGKCSCFILSSPISVIYVSRMQEFPIHHSRSLTVVSFRRASQKANSKNIHPFPSILQHDSFSLSSHVVIFFVYHFFFILDTDIFFDTWYMCSNCCHESKTSRNLPLPHSNVLFSSLPTRAI